MPLDPFKKAYPVSSTGARRVHRQQCSGQWQLPGEVPLTNVKPHTCKQHKSETSSWQCGCNTYYYAREETQILSYARKNWPFIYFFREHNIWQKNFTGTFRVLLLTVYVNIYRHFVSCVCLCVCVRKQRSPRRKARQFTCLEHAKQAHRHVQICWQSMDHRRRARYVQSVVLTTLAFIHILFTKYSILNAPYFTQKY